MPNVGPCERCAQLFTDSSVVESMKTHDYEWSRSLLDILTSAAHGCLFCCLLKRSFALEKPTEKQQSEIVAVKPIKFRLRWLDSGVGLEEFELSSLMMSVEDIKDEIGSVDWGLNKLLLGPSIIISFQVMIARGMFAPCSGVQPF